LKQANLRRKWSTIPKAAPAPNKGSSISQSAVTVHPKSPFLSRAKRHGSGGVGAVSPLTVVCAKASKASCAQIATARHVSVFFMIIFSHVISVCHCSLESKADFGQILILTHPPRC
jgi:hypothetical protein